MNRIAVAPNKFARGFDGSHREVAEAYEVLELREALERTYRTDAHLVCYTVEGASQQPRVNKGGLGAFPNKLTADVFLCDVDNPGHAAWSSALLEAAMHEYAVLGVLRTAGIYHTHGGRRIVQPLSEAIPIEEFEGRLATWMLDLEKAGLAVDWACRDWTRHFRLPHVLRKGVPWRSPVMMLDRMTPIAPPERLVEAPREIARTTAQKRPQGPIPAESDWSREVPEGWRNRIEPLAKAIRGVHTEWHSLFLALSGALLSCGATPAQVPAIVRAISIATEGDTRTADREMGARTTVIRHLSQEPHTALSALRETWPTVACELERPTVAPALSEPVSLEAAAQALLEAIRDAPDGVTVISAECGLGKTRAAMEVATERANKPYANPESQGLRAPSQSKTAISVDKHNLSKQVAHDLERRGTQPRRLFGPLSVRDENGEPECKLHEIAEPLVAGGQPMQWELCRGRDIDPCIYYDTCRAKDGVEGPDDARITVAPHVMISALDGEAGSTGLLVIDEPPDLLETLVFQDAELKLALDHLSFFEERYAASLEPALVAILAWLKELGPVGEVMRLEDAIHRAEHVVASEDLEQARRSAECDGDAVECACRAPVEEGRKNSPPLTFVAIRRAKRDKNLAEELGLVSRILSTVYRGVTTTFPLATRIEMRGRERVLMITRPCETYTNALRRIGSVVVMDANAKVHLPVLRKIVGYAPPTHELGARDGASIERTWLQSPSATRTRWLERGRLDPCQTFLAALRALIDWACEDPNAQSLAIITMCPIHHALSAALGSEEFAEEISVEVRDKLGPILRRWRGHFLFGYYGAVRGLNDMADVDCLATLGDPWPSVDLVRNEVVFLGLEHTSDERMLVRCQAELEQAHGRIRPVHRTRPGRALHVGNVMPSGTGWTRYPVLKRQLGVGRPRNEAAMSMEDLERVIEKLGGIVAAAARIDCDRRTLRRYMTGERAVSAAMARLLNSAVGTANAMPVAGATHPGAVA